MAEGGGVGGGGGGGDWGQLWLGTEACAVLVL